MVPLTRGQIAVAGAETMPEMPILLSGQRPLPRTGPLKDAESRIRALMEATELSQNAGRTGAPDMPGTAGFE